MTVRLTRGAEADLVAISNHIAQDDPRRALSFIRELRARCEDLRNAPNRFPLAERYERSGVRRRLYRRYLIFYRIDPEAVTILHILNGAQDYAAILSSEDD